MKIQISAKQIPLTAELKRKIERRALLALAKFGPRIQRLSVHLCDVNSDKGGVDKFCRASVVLADGTRRVVDQDHTELPAAIDLALERLGWVVGRYLDRRQARRGALSMSGSAR